MFKFTLTIATSAFLFVSSADNGCAMFLEEENSERTNNKVLTTIAPKIFQSLPDDMKALTVSHTAFEQCSDNKFPLNLALVCKEWFKIIQHQLQVGQPCFKAWYGVFGHEDIYETFLNGVLICRGIKISISELKDNLPEETSYKLLKKNPLEGSLDLSSCGDAGNDFVVSTGYRKGINPDNEGKTEIWIAPHFLIKRKIATATHFSGIMEDWDENVAPVGFFFTWSGEANESFDYCTSKGLAFTSKNNLYEIWQMDTLSRQKPPHYPPVVASTVAAKFVHFMFVCEPK